MPYIHLPALLTSLTVVIVVEVGRWVLAVTGRFFGGNPVELERPDALAGVALRGLAPTDRAAGVGRRGWMRGISMEKDLEIDGRSS